MGQHTFFGINNQKLTIIEFMKKNRLKIVILCLILIHLIPVWIVPYFPSQDGPSHLYNAKIMKEYNNPDYKFNEYYDLNLKFFPNWFSHAFLVGLMSIFPPLIAEKLLISIYIILFPLSLFYLINAVNKENISLVILGFLFIYNYLFHMGFYNFVISIPLFFFAMGYWWKNRDYFLLISALILFLYFFMPSSMGGGGFITDRLFLFPFLIILPWFCVKQNKIHKYIILAFILILCIVNVTYVSYYYITLDRDMKEFVSKVDLIEKNKVILPLPLDPYGKSYRIGIFFNSFGYYCLSNGGISLGNYEAGTSYFPVRYKESFGRPPLVTVLHAPRTLDIAKYASLPIDYVIIWGTDPGIENAVGKYWTLISSTGSLKVFRR